MPSEPVSHQVIPAPIKFDGDERYSLAIDEDQVELVRRRWSQGWKPRSGAETLNDIDGMTFMLLPRLPGVAQKAWGPPGVTWTDHCDRLAYHGRLWDQDDLTYFRSSAVGWSS
jgi:hypothetical protein